MYWLSLQRRYWRWRYDNMKHGKNASNEHPLIAQWKAESLPKKSRWKDAEFLVVDTETSSLTPETGELLSIGWVIIREAKILLHTAEHHLVKPQRTVGQSAAIHQLRDCDVDQGEDSYTIMNTLLAAAKNRVLVFHHASLDTAFLNAASKQCFGMPLLWPTIDTLQLEKKILDKQQTPLTPSALRLANCRTRYNLPPYPAHNALTDALATAELLLAQLTHKNRSLRLIDLL